MADAAKDKKPKDMGRAAHAREASEVKSWSQEADVVIVGYGGAGSCAALEARAAGADVLVLERAWQGGGTSIQASGQLYMGGGTPLQKACGFEDEPEEMFKYLMASCGPGADAEKIRLYCERSVEHYHWITGRGVPFKPSFLPVEVGTDPYTDDGLSYTGSELAYPFCEIAKPAPRGHTAQQVGENAGGMMWSSAYFPQIANTMEASAAPRTVADALGGALQPLTLDVTIVYELARET